ncbi:MAG: SDR family oxidoreductase [Pseudomonadota bacterium]|jgi:NAD(P)-dependent dehydrogenase (short-subunit alcohol dehydrogenase family)
MATNLPVALVTGANKGIGFATAHGLAQRNYHVLLGCRDLDRGEDAAAKLRDEGLAADVMNVDVADDDSMARAASLIEMKFGRLDVLVNNAGGRFEEKLGIWSLRTVMRATYEVNVFGIASMIEAMVPLLSCSEHPRIVNMSSGLGSIANNADPHYEFAHVKRPAYNSSKAAVNALTVIYAARLAPQRIKVNSADPGLTATDLTNHRGGRPPSEGAAIAVRLATLADDGPTGGFFDRAGSVPW